MPESPLRDVPFFSGLSDQQLRGLRGIARRRELPARTLVFEAGDPADGLHVILRGAARVYGHDDAGHEVEFSTLEAGDFFGEMALLDGLPRSASVATIADSELLIVPRADFLALLRNSEALLTELLAGLSGRLRGTNEKIFWEMLQRQRLKGEMELERHRSLSTLVAGVAHEINTPLGVVNSAASLITELLAAPCLQPADQGDAGPLLEDLAEAARLIQSNIGRANRLVGSFKELSVRQVSERAESVDLHELVSELQTIYEIQGREQGVRVEAELRLPTEHRVWHGFPGYLSQVALNLLQNAARHAYPEGDGVICLSLTANEVDGEATYLLEVRDRGLGMSEDDRSRAFEPFFTTARERGGTGLGLAIVQNLVTEGLGGELELSSELGVGTTVTVRFPAEVTAAEPGATRSAGSPGAAP